MTWQSHGNWLAAESPEASDSCVDPRVVIRPLTATEWLESKVRADGWGTLSTIFVYRIKGPDSLYNVVVSIASLVKMSSEVKDLALALDVCTALKRIPKGRMARLDQSVEDCLKLLQ